MAIIANKKPEIWLCTRRFSRSAYRRSSRTTTRRRCPTPRTYAETNSACRRVISSSKGANEINVAKAATTLSNAAMSHVVFGCAAAAFCSAETMKSEAIKSATTAATKNALASFKFNAFFSIQIVFRLQIMTWTSLSKTRSSATTIKTETTLSTSKTAAKRVKHC